jgi:predicted nucleic acid-binding protein
VREGVRALIDTGPLVAYFLAGDAYHDWALETFGALRLPAVTCEAVVAEACFLIARRKIPPARLIAFIENGVLQIGMSLAEEAAAARALMERYADVPMSLADACLVRLAEMTGLPICTLDSDFTVYRAHRNRALDLISPIGTHGLHEP